MPVTNKMIAKNVLSVDAASVVFNTIPTSYTDLILLSSARTARALEVDVLEIEFNSVTTGYSTIYMESSGTGASSGPFAELWCGLANGANSTATTFGNSECYIPNYNSTTLTKVVASTSTIENVNSVSYIHFVSGAWNNTAAITSIKVQSRVGSDLKAGSSFFLYGITKA